MTATPYQTPFGKLSALVPTKGYGIFPDQWNGFAIRTIALWVGETRWEQNERLLALLPALDRAGWKCVHTELCLAKVVAK